MRILVITDSVGLSRDTPESVDFYETWPILLSQHNEVHCLRIGGATLQMLFGQMSYYISFKPEILIIQSGIVDAAPRALTDFENQLINRFYLTRIIARRILNKYILKKLRKRRELTVTPINEFEHLIKSIKDQFSTSLIYWIEILPILDFYELSVPNIKRNVHNYNKLIHREFGQNVIELSDIPRSEIMSDGHHLSKDGHYFIYEKVNKLLTKPTTKV